MELVLPFLLCYNLLLLFFGGILICWIFYPDSRGIWDQHNFHIQQTKMTATVGKGVNLLTMVLHRSFTRTTFGQRTMQVTSCIIIWHQYFQFDMKWTRFQLCGINFRKKCLRIYFADQFSFKTNVMNKFLWNCFTFDLR